MCNSKTLLSPTWWDDKAILLNPLTFGSRVLPWLHVMILCKVHPAALTSIMAADLQEWNHSHTVSRNLRNLSWVTYNLLSNRKKKPTGLNPLEFSRTSIRRRAQRMCLGRGCKPRKVIGWTICHTLGKMHRYWCDRRCENVLSHTKTATL